MECWLQEGDAKAGLDAWWVGIGKCPGVFWNTTRCTSCRMQTYTVLSEEGKFIGIDLESDGFPLLESTGQNVK